MFGMPVRRPRVYMLGVRWDARAMATSAAMTELLMCMLAAITRSVSARATDFLLPSSHPLVKRSLEKSRLDVRQKGMGAGGCIGMLRPVQLCSGMPLLCSGMPLRLQSQGRCRCAAHGSKMLGGWQRKGGATMTLQ